MAMQNEDSEKQLGFFKLIIFLGSFNSILGHIPLPIKSLERYAGVTSQVQLVCTMCKKKSYYCPGCLV